MSDLYKISAPQDTTAETLVDRSEKDANGNNIIETYQNIIEKNAVNGYAGLDSDGKIPERILPTVRHDIFAYRSKTAFPAIGTIATLYIALDTSLGYLWSTSSNNYYFFLTMPILGYTHDTAFYGDEGKAVTLKAVLNEENIANHIANTNNPHNVTKTQLHLENVDNTSDINKPISDAQATVNTSLTKSISGISNNLSDEIDTRKNEDAILRNNLNTEISTREANVSSLTTDISNETTRAKTAETAGNAYTKTEIINREKAVADETNARANADENIKTQINTVEDSLNTESTNRTNADNELSTNFTAHENNILNPHKVTKAQVELGNCDNTSDINKPISNLTQAALDLKFDKVPDGTNSFLVNNKINTFYVPDFLLGQLLPGGTIAADGVCTLSDEFVNKYGVTSLTITKNESSSYSSVYFIASDTVNVLSTGDKYPAIQLLVGDWLVSNGANGYVKVDNSDAVQGVKGEAETSYRIGMVNITKANIGLGNVDNTADIDKPISTAQAAKNSTYESGIAQNVSDIKAERVRASSSEVTLSGYISDEETARAYADKTISDNLALHLADVSNPHSVTASQIGLGNVLNVASYSKSETDSLLSNKVSIVSGKDLSSNDFTDALLTKLNGIEAGANDYSLPIASASVLGGIKVGNNLAVTADGTLSVSSIGSIVSPADFDGTKTQLNGLNIGGTIYKFLDVKVNDGSNLIIGKNRTLGSSIVTGAFAIGDCDNSTASGNRSTASGNNSTASGNRSTASGNNSTASGDRSTASGDRSTASGDNSTASGDRSTASGNSSTASGYNSTASGFGSIASGYGSTASGNYSTASGNNSTASGNSSTASGYNSTASVIGSTASGNNSTASGNRSTASGYYSTASIAYEYSIISKYGNNPHAYSSVLSICDTSHVFFANLADGETRWTSYTSFSQFAKGHYLKEYLGCGEVTAVTETMANIIANTSNYFDTTGSGTSADPYVVTPKTLDSQPHNGRLYKIALTSTGKYVTFQSSNNEKCIVEFTGTTSTTDILAFKNISGKTRHGVNFLGGASGYTLNIPINTAFVADIDINSPDMWQLSD